ncbi:MAG: hypothetical protein KDI03_13220 [Anaerolineae bacterium]|nr:hypothetical protein [Anaerolineae bacterium]
MSHSNLDQLLGAVVDADQVLILPHNDPDPDAIASAFGLKKLLMQRRTNSSVQIAFQGIIGRAENKALVRYLGRPLRPLTTATLQHATCIALVDTQPGTGNNPLPADVTPHIVLDHHVWRDETTAAAFCPAGLWIHLHHCGRVSVRGRHCPQPDAGHRSLLRHQDRHDGIGAWGDPC